MGVFGRISDIFKANVNDMLDKMENPEKMIKQMVIEMQEAITKSTSALATAMAQEKKLERDYQGYSQASQNWEAKATQALTAGNEDLARKALAEKAKADQLAAQFKAMYEQANTTTTQLRGQVEQIKVKLQEAKMKESTLLARSQAAKAQETIAKQVGSFDANNAFSKFDKWEQKIVENEAKAQAFTELAEGNTSLNDDFKALEQNSAVDDDLARLKAKLNPPTA